MGAQVTSPARSAERPAPRADRAHAADELGQVMRERDGSARVLIGGRHPGQPGLHRPRQRVARAGLADGHRLGRGEPGSPRQLAGRGRLRFQLPPHRGGIARPQREPGREPAADAEDGVDRPRGIDLCNGQLAPARELLIHQLADHAR